MTVSDLKPHVSEPETSIVEPGVVSATEIEVRGAGPSPRNRPSPSSAKSEPPATAEVEPPAVKQPAVAESADVAVPTGDHRPPSVRPPPMPSPVAPIAKTLWMRSGDREGCRDEPPAPGEVKDAVKKVVTNVLGAVGLNPFVSRDPANPVPDSPAMWAMLAMARKQPGGGGAVHVRADVRRSGTAEPADR